MASTRKCEFCGASLSQYQTVCPKCGYISLQPTSQEEQEKIQKRKEAIEIESNKTLKILFIILGIVFVMALIFSYSFFSNQNQKSDDNYVFAPSGYYRFKDDILYRFEDKWFVGKPDGSWYPVDLKESKTKNFYYKEYYLGKDYNPDWNVSDFDELARIWRTPNSGYYNINGTIYCRYDNKWFAETSPGYWQRAVDLKESHYKNITYSNFYLGAGYSPSYGCTDFTESAAYSSPQRD